VTPPEPDSLNGMPFQMNPGTSDSIKSMAIRIAAGSIGDLRHSVRVLRKSRGFTMITLLTLALCIGANTAIFSMVYALLLKPLPFPQPERIVEIYNTFPKAGLDKMPSNLVQYNDYKTNTASYDAVGLWAFSTSMVGEEGSAERTQYARCTAEMFDVLGLKPVIGQFFTLKNSQPGADNVIVLTQSYWESDFHEDPGVLDRTVRIDGKTVHVIGVAPRALEAFDARVKFVAPIAWTPDRINPQARFALGIPLYARLKPGVPVGQALAEAVAVEKRYYDTAPPQMKAFIDRAGHKIAVKPVQFERVQPVRSSLYLLQGGVIFVLLIGCINVANLLLTRANGRQGELAIRFALGASRGAIARQLLIEGLLLTLTGAALGIALAWGAIRIINRFSAKMLPNMLPFAIDGRVLGFTVILSIAVGLMIGMLPVAHILRANLMELIHRSSRSASGGRGVRALSSALVTGQVAVALVLLTGAGLLIHSFVNALAVNPGFDPRGLVTGRVALPAAYQVAARAATFQQELLQALKDIPGVSDAALASGVPFEGGLPINALTLKDSTLPPNSPQPGAFQVGASVGYFEALHIPLVTGRFFTAVDATASQRAYVVDEHFAQRYFPGRSAVGGHFTFGGVPTKDSDWSVIVGVVRNVPHNGVEDKSNIPFVYYPILSSRPGGLSVLVRSERPLGDLVGLLRAKLRAIDPAIALFETGTVQSAMDESFDNRRAVMLLLGGFAALALFLAALGIYGVLAYDVSQRTREIGIRGALGATRSQIVGLIMRQASWKVGIGLAVGLPSAFLLSSYMESLLFELKPTDPWAYVVVSFLLAAVAALASYLPARHAARIDPIEALRVE
jgi:putative ABC transport system permease protein